MRKLEVGERLEGMASMPIGAFERLVLRMANQTTVRWWRHWNYPAEPRLMVLAMPESEVGDRLEAEFWGLGMDRLHGVEGLGAGWSHWACQRDGG